MHAAGIRPILRARRQSTADRILANVLPFLRITFTVAQPMVKATGLKRACVWMRFGEAIFPKANPAFYREFQIVWRAKQMEVIRHQKVVVDEPCRGDVLPDFMQRVVNRGLRQPLSAFLGTDSEKDPFSSSGGNMDAFGWSAASGIAKGNCAHGRFLTYHCEMRKTFNLGRAAALPYQKQFRQGGAAAPP